jgi:hypothetical protein
MPTHHGTRIRLRQHPQDGIERYPLGSGEVVSRLAVIVYATDKADADRDRVHALRVSADSIQGAPCLDSTGAANHDVIADILPPVVIDVPAPDFLHADVHVGGSGRTVDY